MGATRSAQPQTHKRDRGVCLLWPRRCRPRAPPAGFRLFAYRYTAPTRRGAPELSGQSKVPQCYFSVVSRLARDFSRSTLCMCVDFVCMCIGFGPGSPLAGHESVAESEQQRRPAASPPRSGVFCRMPAQSLSVL